MATNIALKRHKKALRRKAQVAEKRKVETVEASLAGKVRRAATMPIRDCLLSEQLFEIGLGWLIVTRGTGSPIAVGAFLLDVYCLGIKDSMFRSIGERELAGFLETVEENSPLATVDVGHARRLVADLAAWAPALGFAPHRDFPAIEGIFGDVPAESGQTAFQFGYEGKPRYVPGPSEPPWLVHQRIEHLQRTRGEDGFTLDAPA
jgi:hypothetical protein